MKYYICGKHTSMARKKVNDGLNKKMIHLAPSILKKLNIKAAKLGTSSKVLIQELAINEAGK